MHDSYLALYVAKISAYSSTPNLFAYTSFPIDETGEQNVDLRINETVREAFNYLRERFVEICNSPLKVFKLPSFLSDVSEFTSQTREILQPCSDDLEKELQQILRDRFEQSPRNQRETIFLEQSPEKINQALGTDLQQFSLFNSDTKKKEIFYLNLNYFKQTAFYPFLQDIKNKPPEELSFPESFIFGLKLLEKEKSQGLFSNGQFSTQETTREEFDAMVAAAAIIHDYSASFLEFPETSLLSALGRWVTEVISFPTLFPGFTKQNDSDAEKIKEVLNECDAACKKAMDEIPDSSIYMSPKTKKLLCKQIKQKNEYIKKFYKTYCWVTPDFIERCQAVIVDPMLINLPPELLKLNLAEHEDAPGLEPLKLLLRLTPPAELKIANTDEAIKAIIKHPHYLPLGILQALRQGLTLTVNTPEELKRVGQVLEEISSMNYPSTLKIQELPQDVDNKIGWAWACNNFKKRKEIESLIFRAGQNTQIYSCFNALRLSCLKKLDIAGSESGEGKGAYPWQISFKSIPSTLKEISLVGLSNDSYINFRKEAFPHVHSARIYLDQTPTKASSHPKKESKKKCHPQGLAELFPNVQELHLSCANIARTRSNLKMVNLGLEKLDKLETLGICFYDSETYAKDEEILFPKIEWRTFDPGLNLRTITLSCQPEYPTKMNAAIFPAEELMAIKLFMNKYQHVTTIKLNGLQPDNLSKIESWLRKTNLKKQPVVNAHKGQVILTNTTYELG